MSLPNSTTFDGRTDFQTGLPNRTAFSEDIRRRLSEAQRHGNRLSIVLVSMGGLGDLPRKLAPDPCGLVLRACTQFVHAAVREMDLVARYDVETFGLVLPGTGLRDSITVAQRLKRAVEGCPIQVADAKIHFNVSAGVAEAQPGEEVADFIARASLAKQTSAADDAQLVHFHDGASVEIAAMPSDGLALAAT